LIYEKTERGRGMRGERDRAERKRKNTSDKQYSFLEFLLTRPLILLDKGPTLMTSSNLNYFLYSTLEVSALTYDRPDSS
jgi:hypothetical protein